MTSTPTKSKQNNLYKIVTNDFIIRGITLGIFTQIEVDKLKVNYKSMKLLEFINYCLSTHFLSIHDISKIILYMAKGNTIILEYSEGKYYLNIRKQRIEFPFTENLQEDIFPLYKESIDTFHFNNKEKNIVIHSANHLEKKLYILIPAPTTEIYEEIKTYLKESDELKKERPIYYEDINGNNISEVIKYQDYKRILVVAGLDMIEVLHTSNNEIGNSVLESVEIINDKLDKIGIDTNKKSNTFVINESLQELKGTIDGILLSIILQQNKLDASDIHIEPLLDTGEGGTDAGFIRYRADGDLTERKRTSTGEYKPTIPNKYDALIERLKILCGMNSTIRHVPQDGKLVLRRRNDLYEYRVSVMPEGEPGSEKEKAVLRKLSRDTSFLDLNKLNMDADKKAMIDDFVGNPKDEGGKRGRFNNGMILMTGPTGSGKSTTLFSILNQINIEELNIQTLEDPIEYVIPGLNQSQIANGSYKGDDPNIYNYSKGIKACLRQDPDVILIGEIRDEVTMEAAKDAAATGHLVFASLHTNDTWQTLDRLEGIGFDMHLVGNIIRLIMAQRLGKLACYRCIKEYNDPSFSQVYNKETQTYNIDRKLQQKREDEYLNRKMAVVRKLLDSQYIMDLPDDISDLKLWEATGENGSCSVCKGSKIKGRTGIVEFLPITAGVEKMILENGSKVENSEVKKLYIRENITTLYQNALWKTFHPIKDAKYGNRYMTYEDAQAGAGADVYEWGKEYIDASYQELNTLLKQKKAERKIQDIDLEIQSIGIQISGEEKRINNINRKEKEAIILKLKGELKELIDKKTKLQAYIKELGL